MINAYKQHVGWTDRLGNQGKSTFESDALKQGEFHEFCRHLQPGLHCMKYMEYKKEPWYPGLQLSLCRTSLDTTLLVFSCCTSNPSIESFTYHNKLT